LKKFFCCELNLRISELDKCWGITKVFGTTIFAIHYLLTRMNNCGKWCLLEFSDDYFPFFQISIWRRLCHILKITVKVNKTIRKIQKKSRIIKLKKTRKKIVLFSSDYARYLIYDPILKMSSFEFTVYKSLKTMSREKQLSGKYHKHHENRRNGFMFHCGNIVYRKKGCKISWIVSKSIHLWHIQIWNSETMTYREYWHWKSRQIKHHQKSEKHLKLWRHHIIIQVEVRDS
jgi:hypothetical protein